MTDAEAREIARTETTRPLVVEAGAGTGKTTTLIARITTWCLGGGWELAARTGIGDDSELAAKVLDGVVAITFTEAAAAEMAGRFGAALVEVAAGRPVLGVPALPCDPERARLRARALLGAIDRLVVSTIHAFCARILAAAPTEAGLHPAHRVDADGTLTMEVVHEVVVDWFTAAFGAAAGEDAATAVERDNLVHLAVAGFGSEQVVDALSALAAEAVDPEALEDDAFSATAVQRCLDTARRRLGALGRLLNERLKGAVGRAEKAVDLRRALGTLWTLTGGPPTDTTLDALRDAARALRNDDTLRKWARGDFTATEKGLFADDRAQVVETARAVRPVLEHLARLDPTLTRAATGILAPLLRRVRAELRRRGIVSFAQLLRGAHDLLQKDERLRRRYRAGMTQLLVDEFQDTDALQCELVRMLALEGDHRPGLFLVGDPKQSIYGWRSADLVAYQRFVDDVVGAGGQLLLLTVNRRSLPPILAEVDRVVAPIMGFDPGYQARFQPLSSARAEDPLPPEPFAAIEHWVSWGEGEEDTGSGAATELEARALAADLLRLRHETQTGWDRIGVLLRSTGDLERYLSALRDAGIPFVVERNKQYFRRREIIDAVALVRCLLEPEDTLALLTVLRSPLVGVPDAALLPLWQEHLPERMAALDADHADVLDTLRGIAHRASAVARASGAPGLDRIAGWEELLVRTAGAIGWLRAHWPTLPADVFVQELRERLPLEALAAARYLGGFRVANLQRFYTELVEALGEGDAQRVVRALRAGVSGGREAEEARPTDSVQEAVRVMTIHKAKGLDFDHVYVVQLHKGRRGGFREEGFAVREFRGQREYRLFGTRTPGYLDLAEHDQRVEHHERVRLLYVAMTRARDRLVLMGNWDPPAEPVPVASATSLLDLLYSRADRPDLEDLRAVDRIDHDGATWRRLPADPGVAPEATAEPPHIPTTPTDETVRRARAEARQARPTSVAASAEAHDAFDTPPATDPSAPASGGSPFATAVGTAVHHAIELMDPKLPKTAALEAALAVVRADLAPLPEPDHAAAVERAERLVTRFVQGPLGARFRAVGIVARELPMLAVPSPDQAAVGFVSGTLDLLFRDPVTGELVVGDYKTDAVPTDAALAARADAYARQMRVYTRAVKAALGLAHEPRAELWFLARDWIVQVEPA